MSFWGLKTAFNNIIKFNILIILFTIIQVCNGQSFSRNDKIKLLSQLSDEYQNTNFSAAYETAQNLANLYLSINDSVNYFNYLNKSISYYSQVDADSALLLQKKLIIDCIGNSQLEKRWSIVILDQYVNLLKKSINKDHDFSFLEDKLMTIPKSKTIHPDILYTLGQCYLHNENFSLSTQYFTKSILAGYPENFGVFIKIGRNEYSQGEYGLALDVFALCIELCESDFDKAFILNYLGNCFYKLEDFEQAKEIYKLSKVFRQKISPNAELLAIINQNIANSYRTINKDSAYSYYQEAIINSLNTKPINLKLLANSYNNLGNMYFEKNLLDSALYYFNKGYVIRKDSLGNNNFYISQSAYNLSSTFLSMGEIKHAIDFAKLSIEYQDSTDQKNLKRVGTYSYSFSNYDRFYSFEILGDAYYNLYAKNKSLDFLRQSLNSYNSALEYIRNHQESIHEEKSKLIKSAEKKELILKSIKAQFALDSLLHTRNPQMINYLMSESHSSVLSDLLLEKKLRNSLEHSRVLKKLSTCLLTVGENHLTFKKLDSIVQSIDPNLKLITDNLFKKSKNHIDSIRHNNNDSTVQLKSIPSDEVSLAFLIDQEESTIYYLISQGNEMVYNCIYSREILIEIKKLNQAYKNYDFNKADRSIMIISEILKPITDYLSSFEKDVRLVITPDSELWNLPFDAIMIQKELMFKPLAELFEVFLTFTPNTRTSFSDESLTKNDNQHNDWFGFAPGFFSTENSKLANLPGSITEVKNISKILNANFTTKTYINSEASLENLYEISPESYLHFSTHNYKNPNTGHTEIILKSKSQLQELTYDKILLNNLGPEFVFLNICSGFMGDYISGEGPINLTRAFILNGTNQLIYTLYRTPDIFASEFASTFYKNLKLLGSPIKALTKTKRFFLLKSRYNSPIFWGNYQIIESRQIN